MIIPGTRILNQRDLYILIMCFSCIHVYFMYFVFRKVDDRSYPSTNRLYTLDYFQFVFFFQRDWPSAEVKRTKVRQAVLDTFLWQALASVIIPGFTINRLCFFSHMVLARTFQQLPAATRKWTVTAIGLGAIPVIIHPIDRSVDWLMENTVRKWYGIGPVLETEIVHHRRKD